MDDHSPYSLRAVDRAFEILHAFSDERSRLSLSDISRRTGLPLTTVHRLVGVLARWGALERDEGHRYTIGLQLWEMAVRSPRSALVREIALPFLASLHEATQGTARLSILDRTDVVILEQIATGGRPCGQAHVGDRLPACATAEGHVLLAHARADAPAGPCPPVIAGSASAACWPLDLRRLLAEVRRTGVAVRPPQPLGHTCVAAPVRDASGAVVAAVSVLVTRRRASRPALVAAVTFVSCGISDALASRGSAATQGRPGPATGESSWASSVPFRRTEGRP